MKLSKAKQRMTTNLRIRKCMTTPAALLALILLSTTSANTASAQSADLAIIDDQLDIQPATIFGIDARSLRLMDDGRLRRDIPLNRLIALVPTWWTTPDASSQPPLSADTPIRNTTQRPLASTDGVLETNTGSWLFGQITQPPNADTSEQQPPQTNANTIHFNARRLGVIPVPIDDIRTIWFDAPSTPNDTRPQIHPAALDADGADVVILRTGERLVGFIESINETSVAIDDQRTGLVNAPTGRVLALRFGGPPQPHAAATVWLNDGTVIAGLTLAEDTTNEPVSARRGPMLFGSLPLGQSTLPVSLPINDIDAVLLNSSSLVALASFSPTSQHPIGTRIADSITNDIDPLSPPRPLFAADILLPGPMEVRWQIPDNAVRIAFDAVLPDDCRIWGDCDVRVYIDQPRPTRSSQQDSRSGEHELAAFSLSGSSPVHRVNAVLEPAPRRELVVRVEPGNFGPIQDRVQLRRGIILLGTP